MSREQDRRLHKKKQMQLEIQRRIEEKKKIENNESGTNSGLTQNNITKKITKQATIKKQKSQEEQENREKTRTIILSKIQNIKENQEDQLLKNLGLKQKQSTNELEGSCELCRIVEGKTDSKIVEKNSDFTIVLARGSVKGEIKIIPNRHYHNFNDIDVSSFNKMFRNGVRLMRAIKESDLSCEGLICSINSIDGNSIHPHLHIIPRYPDDQIKILRPTKNDEQSTQQMENVLSILKEEKKS